MSCLKSIPCFWCKCVDAANAGTVHNIVCLLLLAADQHLVFTVVSLSFYLHDSLTRRDTAVLLALSWFHNVLMICSLLFNWFSQSASVMLICLSKKTPRQFLRPWFLPPCVLSMVQDILFCGGMIYAVEDPCLLFLALLLRILQQKRSLPCPGCEGCTGVPIKKNI